MLKRFKRWLYTKLRNFLDITSPPTSDDFIANLRQKGMTIGNRTVFFDPKSVVIDGPRPWLITIGDDVQITYGVSILTHGYDWAVLKGLHAEVLGSAGSVTIGNNVFIGANSMILKNAKIGNNVIIGAGSIVTGHIPDNCVAAGNPCRVICGIEEYYRKRKDAQFQEATVLVKSYRRAFKEDPPAEKLSEFFFLFANEEKDLDPSFASQMRNAGNYDETIANYIKHKPLFDSMASFLKSIPWDDQTDL